MRAMALALAGVLAAAPWGRAQDGSAQTPPDPNLPIRIEEIRRLVLEERRRAREEAERNRAAAGLGTTAAQPPRFQLGSFGRPSSPREYEAFLMTAEGPRFEYYLEVYGRTPQERIDEILRDAKLLHGPAPRHSSPTVQEMSEYRSASQGVNVLPAVDWLMDKIKKKLKR